MVRNLLKLVSFRDIPEAITQGEDIADALLQGSDCLTEFSREFHKLNETAPR